MKFEQPPISLSEQEQVHHEETPEGSFEKYLYGFQLDSEYLRGKRILDAGCGDQALFVRHALEQELDVIGVDPEADPALVPEGRLIRSDLASAGIGSVDIALSYAAIGAHPKIHIRSSLEYLLDHLNEGGEIRIYPYDSSETLKGIRESKARMDEALAGLADRINVSVTEVEEHEMKNGQRYTSSVLIIRKKPKEPSK